MVSAMASKITLITIGVVAALSGGATIAGAAGGDQRSNAQAAPVATTSSSEYREHRRECLRERRREGRAHFKREHGTIRRCIAQERRADANERDD